MVMKNIVASAIALASLAGAANAGTITITGYTAGGASTSAATVAVNGVASGNFDLSSAGDTLRGIVNASNITTGNTQVLTLTLTNFVFSTASTRNIQIVIEQDYTVDAPFIGAGATGSHQLNGDLTLGGQGGSLAVRVDSLHEATSLPVLAQTYLASTNPLNLGQGSTTNVAVTGSVYTIRATYNFTLTGNGTLAVFNLPDSGVDNATFSLVPLPSASIAGMGGLALLGAGVAVRRRRMNRA